MLGQVVLGLVLVAGAWGQVCQLSTIPVQQNVDEARLAGRWFELKWHAGSLDRFNKFNQRYSDYFIDLIHHGYPYGHTGYPYNYYNYPYTSPIRAHTGFAINQFFYDISLAKCSESHGAWDRTIANVAGKYKDTSRPNGVKQPQQWIMETDYDTYMIKFQCLDVVAATGTCQVSEVNLWAKANANGDIDAATIARVRIAGEARLRALLAPVTCVSRSFVYSAVPITRPSKCISLTHAPYYRGLPGVGINMINYLDATRYPATTYPATTYPYYYAGMHGMHGMHGGMTSHPELVAPMKEKLIAEKAKLIAERAQLLIKKEKLQLEIARLRGLRV